MTAGNLRFINPYMDGAQFSCGNLEEFKARLTQGVDQAIANEPTDAVPPEELGFIEQINHYSVKRQVVDWPKLLELSLALAAQRCELKVYNFLSLASFQISQTIAGASGGLQAGYAALAASLEAYCALVQRGWDRCIPKRADRREGQLKWLSEELAQLVRQSPPQPADAHAFLEFAATATRLAELSGAALSLGRPTLYELRQEFDRIVPELRATIPSTQALESPAQSAPQRVPGPSESHAAIQPVAASVAQPPAMEQPTSLSSEVAAPKSGQATPPSGEARAPQPLTATDALTPSISTFDDKTAEQQSQDVLEDQLSLVVRHLVGRLRATSLLDPAPYWLIRALRWANHALLSSESIKSIVANQHKTYLPYTGTHRQLAKQIPLLVQQGQFAEAVSLCEERFEVDPLWLDLQRWVDSALVGLGANQARETVQSQVRLLLARCPELPRFKFSDRDGTGFADVETTAWLTAQSSGSTGGNGQNFEGERRLELPAGLMPSLAVLQQELAHAPSTRVRFEIQLQTVEVLLTHRRSDIAVPIVEELLAVAEAHHLEQWDPQLFFMALRLAVKSARAAELDDARRSAFWGRLCRANPAIAVELGPEATPSS